SAPPHRPESSPLPVLERSAPPPDPPSFPTRRSSDLATTWARACRSPVMGRSQTFRPSRRSITAIRSHPCSPRPNWTATRPPDGRSEEHTSELQSREKLVCRLLLGKKKKITWPPTADG